MSILKKIVCMFLLATSTFALTKTIDIRNMSEKNAYYIVFCARKPDIKNNKSLTGHAFVIFGIEDHQKKMSISSAFGFYPKNGKGIVEAVPGKIAKELFSSKISSKLIVKVNSHHWQEAKKIKKKWQNKKYHLTKSDCVSYVIETANAIGIKVAKRKKLDLPYEYIDKLIAKN